MSKLVERECPNCGANININIDSELEIIKCEYCDTTFEPLASKNYTAGTSVDITVTPIDFNNFKKSRYIISYLLHRIMGIIITIAIIAFIFIPRLSERLGNPIMGVFSVFSKLNDSNGNTTLMEAVSDGNIEMVEVLKEAGANLEAKDTWGNTALMGAVSDGNIEAVNVLKEAGAK